MSCEDLAAFDPEVWAAIQREEERLETTLELIASENFVSPRIMAAEANVMTNKYAEGYPAERYYEGNVYVDEVERLAVERAKELFGAEHANVQPHAGSQANMAVYFSCLKPGDTLMSMGMSQGGHLSHGSPASFSGQLYRIVSYTVDRETERIDFDEVRRVAEKERPKLIVAGASSYPRAIDFEAFGRVAKSVGARLMVDMAHIAGLIAAGLHPSPVPWADYVTSTTHKTLRGPRGGFILSRAEHAKAIDQSVFPGIQGGPFMHIIAAKAVAFKEAFTSRFKTYEAQLKTNAARLAQALAERGFRLVAGGTDTHLMLIDLTQMGITGADAAVVLDRAGITLNKNSIPFDPRPPRVTSGVRLGTPAVTTRGMREPEMDVVAGLITEVLARPHDPAVQKSVRKKVRELCARFPLNKRPT